MADVLQTPDGASYEMGLVYEAERRVGEIAIVTNTKAPELMSTFSRASFILGRHLRALYAAEEKARQAVAHRRAVMIIDVIPEKLKARPDLKANDDVRQSYIDLDPEYEQLKTRLTEHEAATLYVKTKARDMEGALNAVKKAMDGTDKVWLRPNYNMTSGTEPESASDPMAAASTDLSISPTTKTTSGFAVGKARY